MLPREWFTARREKRFLAWLEGRELTAHTRYALLRHQANADASVEEVLADVKDGRVPGIGRVRMAEVRGYA